ncbi:protein O-mannosyl-transferase TMTC2-like isoform X3 [Dunckerocampus dactyliophorus]|uniref:protein O-mannosyl-transferase TMTC2-like isoform X3 n=1 Tax=Dunckerocampus dactyliophorus TaxID=161453 RepID=UPI00240621C4|nr:protein O-mannosyl-transferase TMTC2-like isoform X3 [Dunckerocampus dactyliophorus]
MTHFTRVGRSPGEPRCRAAEFHTIRGCFTLLLLLLSVLFASEHTPREMITELLCSAVAVGVYVNTLDADFCYDDSRAIKTNQDLLPETPWTNILYDDFWGTLLTHSGSHKSFRPLCTLSFRLNYALHGLRPRGYHLLNVALHGLVTAAFTAYSRPLLGGGLWSLLAGLLFATHPVHTEAVAGVVGRADVGAALFFLLSLLSYARHCGLRGTLHTRRSCWAWMLGSLWGAAASMLWKEQGVTVLAVSAVYDLFVFHRLTFRQALLLPLRKKKNPKLLLSLCVLACWGVILLSGRIYWMGNKPPNFSNSDNPAADSLHLLTRMLTFLHLPAANAWLLLCPDKLSFDWSMDAVPLVRSLADWRNLHTLGFYAWGNLGNVLKSQGKMAEAEKAYRNALHYRSNMADMLYNLGLLLQENQRFPEALHYYKKAIGSRPTLASAYLNMGIILMNRGSLEEAKRTFVTCADIPDDNLKDPHTHKSSVTSCLYNLGKMLHEQGRQEVSRRSAWPPPRLLNGFFSLPQDAISVYKQAVQRMPRHFAPHSLFNMMGEAYMRLDRLEEAGRWYKESLRAKPDHIPAHLTYGKLLSITGERTEAEKYYLRAIELDPLRGSCYMHYGQFLLELSRLPEAAEMAERAAELDGSEFDVVFSAAHMLRQASLNEAAERQYKRAAGLRPDYPAALMNLGAILHLNGRLSEAEANYLRALQLKPDDAITRSNLRKLWNIMERQGLATRKLEELP